MKKSIILFLFLPFILRGQVFFNGKDMGKCTDEYLTVMQTIHSKPKGVNYYYNGVASGDTTGSWITTAKLSLKQYKSFMKETIEKQQIRDSLGVVVPLKTETDLFNLMSKIGFEYLKKEPPAQNELLDDLAMTTIYTFKRRRT